MGTIYLIGCKQCGPLYVGESGCFLRTRISHHLADISANNQQPISIHFNQSNHSSSDFKFQAIDYNNDITKRRSLESRWIKRLNTLHPVGLNTISQYKPVIPFIIPYAPCYQTIGNNVIRSINNKLGVNARICYTRHRNLKETLCPSKVK
jgi:hypothetical protein